MTDIDKVINKEINQVNKGLSLYQRWLMSNNSSDFNNLDWDTISNPNARNAEIVKELQSRYTQAGLILDGESVGINYGIDFREIDAAYRAREEITKLLIEAYQSQGMVYGGRTLFVDYDVNNILTDNNYGKHINTKFKEPLLKGIGYGGFWDDKKWVGNYKKLSAEATKINKQVLEKFWNAQYQATEKHLLEKFNEFDGDLSKDGFEKKIKATKELIADVNKSKQWEREVRSLIQKAKALEYQNKKALKSLTIQIKQQPLVTMYELEQIGRAILGLSTEYCPIQTGRLRNSGTLYVKSNSIEIIYQCEYAAYVHDNPNNVHPIGRHHFLEDAAQEILRNRTVWTESTGQDVMGSHMYMKYEKPFGENGKYTWVEGVGYNAIKIEIDNYLRVNYQHYK